MSSFKRGWWRSLLPACPLSRSSETMPLKSKVKQSGSKTDVPKPKQIWQPTTNWSDLPSDIMLNILERVGAVYILQNVQKVCTAWRDLCKEPSIWRVVYMDLWLCQSVRICREMCKQAVARSQGQLVDLTVIAFCDYELLRDVVDRLGQLRRLAIRWSSGGYLSEALKKLPLLEELSFVESYVPEEYIEVVGRYCPLLRTLKLNFVHFSFLGEDTVVALAIGRNLPQLTHLELIYNKMENTGLQAILDGCCHLESLDLRGCWNVDIKGELGKRCSQQIKHLKLPYDKENPYYRL